MVVALWGVDGGDDPGKSPPTLVVVRHPMVPTGYLHSAAAFIPEGLQVKTLQVRSPLGLLASQHRR